jgi:hypothetical protein
MMPYFRKLWFAVLRYIARPVLKHDAEMAVIDAVFSDIDSVTPRTKGNLMWDKIYSLEGQVAALTKKVLLLERRMYGDSREAAVKRRPPSHGGADAEALAMAWLKTRHGCELRGGALENYLARNADVRNELISWLRAKQNECSTQSFKETLQAIGG